MHDIWNPWHGCRKVSVGCQNCYMYYLDSLRDKDGSVIYRTQAGFRYPLSKERNGRYNGKIYCVGTNHISSFLSNISASRDIFAVDETKSGDRICLRLFICDDKLFDLTPKF